MSFLRLAIFYSFLAILPERAFAYFVQPPAAASYGISQYIGYGVLTAAQYNENGTPIIYQVKETDATNESLGFIGRTKSSVYVGGLPVVDSQASFQSTLGYGGFSESYAFLSYQFEIVGDDTGTLVPFIIRDYGTIEKLPGTTSSDLAFGDIAVVLPELSYFDEASLPFGDQDKSASLFLLKVLYARPNTLYTVALEASASAKVLAGSTGSPGVSASIDPYFSILPEYSSRYSLLFSPGIKDVDISAVPLPSSFCLLSAAFAMLYLSRFLKRRSNELIG